MLNLGTLLGGTFSGASFINEPGEIVGNWRGGPDGVQAFFWDRGQFTDLDAHLGSRTLALSLNNRGQVAGRAVGPAEGPHAFLWQDGVFTDLGAGLGMASSAQGINNRGDVVGWNGAGHAMLWQTRNCLSQ